jgi:hypothetical protein
VTVIQVTPGEQVNTDDLVKVEYQDDQSAPLGQRADLLVVRDRQLHPAVTEKVTTIAALQQLRATIGDGTGSTRWVRVRQEGTIGDNEDSYVNLDKVRQVELSSAADGAIARLRVEGDADVGQVHHPAALQKVRDLRML